MQREVYTRTGLEPRTGPDAAGGSGVRVDGRSARSRLDAGSQVRIPALLVVAEHRVMAPQPFRLMARVVEAVPRVVRHAVVGVLAETAAHAAAAEHEGAWLGRFAFVYWPVVVGLGLLLPLRQCEVAHAKG